MSKFYSRRAPGGTQKPAKNARLAAGTIPADAIELVFIPGIHESR
jgi:hypothetical protein